jgi:hypothetical protein
MPAFVLVVVAGAGVFVGAGVGVVWARILNGAMSTAQSAMVIVRFFVFMFILYITNPYNLSTGKL